MQGVRSIFLLLLKSCFITQGVASRHGAAHGSHTGGNDWEGVTAPLGKHDDYLDVFYGYSLWWLLASFFLDLWLHLSKEQNTPKSMGVWTQPSVEGPLRSL